MFSSSSSHIIPTINPFFLKIAEVGFCSLQTTHTRLSRMHPRTISLSSKLTSLLHLTNYYILGAVREGRDIKLEAPSPPLKTPEFGGQEHRQDLHGDKEQPTK